MNCTRLNAFAAFTLSMAIIPITARSADLVVDTLVDNLANDSICTLREATRAANADADADGCVATGVYGDDEITFSVAGTIDLIEDLEIRDNLRVVGGGQITLDAGMNDRIFDGNGEGLELRLEGLTLQNGRAPAESRGGGCISMFGFSTLLETTDVTIRDCGVLPSSFGDGAGGAILIGVSPEIIAPLRSAELRGGSGAVTRLTLTRTVMTDNLVQTEDGRAVGGAVSAGPDLVAVTIVDSRIVDNRAESQTDSALGGGLHLVQPAPLIIQRSELSFNLTSRLDAGSTGGASGAQGSLGGAIFIDEVEELSLIANTTIANNRSFARGPAGTEARGGAIHGFVDDDLTLELNNVTITGNTTDADDDATASAGGLDFPVAFGAPISGPVFLANSILAGNSAEGLLEDCSATGVVASRGHNIVQTNCAITAAIGDQFGVDPMLAPLDENGGNVPGMRSREPLAFSSALDSASPEPVQTSSSACRSVDQRGEVRPADSGSGLICDIGAVEVQAAPLPPARPVPGPGLLGLGLLGLLMLLVARRYHERPRSIGGGY